MKPEIIGRGRTADDKEVCLWNDGSLTWGRVGTVIKGSPHARTPAQVDAARSSGWLVLGDLSLYDADEVPRLIASARKVGAGSRLPGDVRSEFERGVKRDKRLKPVWVTQEADRNGKPLVRVWKLPRALGLGGYAVWDEVRGSRGRGRYQLMQEMGRAGTGSYAPTGIQFADLDSLSDHIADLRARNRG